MRRTTIALEETLFKGAKRVAIETNRSFQQIVAEALRRYLGMPEGSGVPSRARWKRDPFITAKAVDLGDPLLSQKVDDIVYGDARS